MAKGGFRGGYGGGFAKRPAKGALGGMNMDMLKKAQQMQQEAMELQKEIEAKEFRATAGGGMVTAVVSGKKELLNIEIDPEAVDPEDVEMLQDMVCAAVNEAIRNINEESNARLSAVTGGMGLPGMGGGMPGIPGLR